MYGKQIVGRQMIVGHGRRGPYGGGHPWGGHGGQDYEELREFGTGAGPVVAPPMMGHPLPPPGHPQAHMHPAAHPEHPHHHHWRASQGIAPEGYNRHHPRGTPWSYQRHEGGPVVIEEHPTHTREFPIGFIMFDLPGNGAQTGIEQKPQVLFRGERLAVPASIVANFDIADIKVGKDSQLAAPGNMPAECFSNLSVGVRMQLDSAEPGITITLFAQNNAAEDQDFKSVLYGTVIE